MFDFMGSGLRVVDLRDPAKPREVAYYHPGAPASGAVRSRNGTTAPAATDSCMSHNYFVQETGQIWFVCRDSGFHVAELSPEVRAYLGVPAKPKPR